METKIPEYKTLLKYIDEVNDSNFNAEYRKVDSSHTKYDEYKNKREDGAEAINILRDILSNFNNFGTNNFSYQRIDPGKWLDGSNTKVRNYLWGQLKIDRKNPIGLSIFVEHYAGTSKFRISMDIKDTEATKDDIENFHKFLELSQFEDVILIEGTSQKNNVREVDYSFSEARNRVKTGLADKIQPSIIVELDNTKTDEDYNNSVIKAVNTIEKYFSYVMRSYDTRGSMSNETITKTNDYKLSKNTILYGPPGTGKTYNSVNYAIFNIDFNNIINAEELDLIREE
ncbi:hypothetical protein [Facklamia sp. P12955]|uniref:hypothetical protein n=1 Tax=Facklamia sp. P12955 TaxID=3421946 RepID=UPI003D18586F